MKSRNIKTRLAAFGLALLMGLTITLFLLAWMNRDMQGMRSCGESMTTGERVSGWNRKAVKSNTAFVFRPLGKAAGWQYMKPVLTPWLI